MISSFYGNRGDREGNRISGCLYSDKGLCHCYRLAHDPENPDAARLNINRDIIRQ